ncbi:MAG: hypothetical protein JWM78_1793 [Verrucomicrobiaceae bacterium]|nr:hypothetical protein [Verrucomicrobiaceae bacterium]
MSELTSDDAKLPRGRYRHFKGNLYEVIATAKHSETQDDYVVYRALYGEHGLWVRPLAMFIEQVQRDGKTFPRFEFLPDSDRDPGT